LVAEGAGGGGLAEMVAFFGRAVVIWAPPGAAAAVGN